VSYLTERDMGDGEISQLNQSSLSYDMDILLVWG